MRRIPVTPMPVHEERLSSWKTDVLFIGLTLLFLGLLVVRLTRSGFGYLAALFLFLSCFFLFYFYAVNYHTLFTRITREALALRFGVFRWTVPWDTVAGWHRDDTSMWRICGAGIHFTMIRRRYRVYFNFLEHPRVVLELSEPRGPVRDVVFSTKRPAGLLDAVGARAGGGNAAPPER